MYRAVIIVCLLMCISTAAIGDELVISPYAGVESQLSIYQGWLNLHGGVEVAFKKWLALGTQLQGIYGLTYHDAWVNGFVYGRLWILTVGVGAGTRLLESELPDGSEYDTIGTPSDPINLSLTSGLEIPLFRTKSVEWSLLTSMDFVVTDVPIQYEDDEDLSFFETIIANLISGIAQGAVGGGIGSFKGGIGFHASFGIE